MKFPTVTLLSLIFAASICLFCENVDGFSYHPSTCRVTHGNVPALKQGSTRRYKTELQISTIQPVTVLKYPLFQDTAPPIKRLGTLSATLTKIGMMLYIASMCMALPVALFPPFLLHRLGFITKMRQEQLSLSAGQFCARWLLRLIPFCKIHAIPHREEEPEPSIWVCNHTSALDVFMLLAADKTLRGKSKRPIKVVYWKQLEKNPITKMLFQQCGFIPVQMAANKAGEDNDYDVKSFKNLLKQSKKAFEEGFDVGILPEGQLNPNPEESLLPCFPGAFTLARMSKRPIQMMALHGTHRLWHAKEDIGMTVTGREVRIRVYPNGRKYKSGEEFLATFNAVVGHFATKGFDLHHDELNSWLNGRKWQELTNAEAEA